MTDATPIPLVDLALQHRRVRASVMAAIAAVADDAAFVLSAPVRDFEDSFAAYCGVAHAVGVGNGTDAIELALRGLEVGPGDEVILPANTFVATAEAVIRSGAQPVLVDCDEDSLIDVDDVARHVTGRTRAVVPVHLYGQMAPVEAIRAVVGDGVAVVEDAAQAHGARRHGARAGSLGDAAATSFYPGKNLGAYGDGGAVLTGSDEVAGRVRALRNHGGTSKYEHRLLGTNSRLDGIQAAVLSVKLTYLDEWNDERRSAASRYQELLEGVPGVRAPRVVAGNEHVWHLYVVRTPRRDEVVARLNAAGIAAAVHYPAPVHLLPAFRWLGQGPGTHPMSEALAGEILSLPIYPGITPAQQERVADELRGAVRG